jgi:hypothetical protein
VSTRRGLLLDGYLGAARVSAFATQSLAPLRELLKRPNLSADTRRGVEAQIAQGEGRFQDAIALWEGRTDADPVRRLENIACCTARREMAGKPSNASTR